MKIIDKTVDAFYNLIGISPFKRAVLKYFKVGSSYMYLPTHQLMVCTGHTAITACGGDICRKNAVFGSCDGSIQPVFDCFRIGVCVYDSDGSDKFTKIELSNSRW